MVDGQIWTSAGMSAGVDLALAIVENDLGLETARGVARKLVLYQRRGGGQSQFSALLELDARSDRVQMALAYAQENLASDLSVERLAEAAHLSPRQFSRVFREETGQSPAKAVERLRVEAARLMMETTRHPIEVIARETGFGDREADAPGLPARLRPGTADHPASRGQRAAHGLNAAQLIVAGMSFSAVDLSEVPTGRRDCR